MDTEDIVMNIISNAGGAHALAMEAIKKARAKDFDAADALLAEGFEALKEAHAAHFKLLRAEAKGEQAIVLTMLVTHAQDHLMNAQTTHDLAKEIVEICREK